MKSTLKPGLKHSFSYKVPENKTVPYTYPESPIIAQMPKVFATGFMIVLMEWTCTQLLSDHLERWRRQSRHACRRLASRGHAARHDSQG